MLPLQSFDEFVSNMAAAVQGACKQLTDLAVGSVLRAILEANASVGLWLQWLILRVLQVTRAATSSGADLDSWMADFGVTRLPGTAAVGMATFSRWVPTLPAVIPLGTAVRSGDGKQSFVVTQDSGNLNWSLAQTGYILAAGVASVDVPIAAQSAGRAGNVQAGAVTLISSAIPGVDTVLNNGALTGGSDGESDDALRRRFGTFLDSRARATRLAVENALLGVQPGLTWTMVENQDPSGSSRPGFVTVTVNDGSGAPSDALIAQIAVAVDAVRPVGTTIAVVRPQSRLLQIEMTLGIAAGAPSSVVQANVTSAIGSYVGGLAIGSGLPASRLMQVAYDGDPAVVNVTGLTINGVGDDVPPQASSLLVVGAVVLH